MIAYLVVVQSETYGPGMFDVFLFGGNGEEIPAWYNLCLPRLARSEEATTLVNSHEYVTFIYNGYIMNVFPFGGVVLLVAGLGLFACGAEASTVFPEGTNSGSSLQNVLNGIASDGNSDVILGSYIKNSLDTQWSITGSQGVATLIIELAGFAGENVFGVYDLKSDNKTLSYVPLFNGGANSKDHAVVNINSDGSVIVEYVNYINKKKEVVQTTTYTDAGFTDNSFGFFLDSSKNFGGGIAYSDTSLNKDGMDHMVAYQGKGEDVNLGSWGPDYWTPSEYLLAFEDLFIGPDWDYEDMVVMVSSVAPIPLSPAPEPATLVLLGAGCAGFGWRMKRRKR